MAKVVLTGKPIEERIRDRLLGSGDLKAWPADCEVMVPNRTISQTWFGGTQQGAANQPKGSHAEAVGAGESFLGGMSESAINKTYGLGTKQSGSLDPFALKRRR